MDQLTTALLYTAIFLLLAYVKKLHNKIDQLESSDPTVIEGEIVSRRVD